MNAAADLSALSIVADAREANADALIAQADTATLARVLGASLAAASDPAQFRKFTQRGQARLVTFTRRLAKHYNARQSGARNAQLSGLGRTGSAFHVLYPKPLYAQGKTQSNAHLAGLGSWLSSAFRSVTGTSLGSVAGPILGAVATIYGGPVAGALVTAAVSGASRPNTQNAPAVIPATTTAQQQAAAAASAYSITAPNVRPTRPTSIPADWVPTFIETLSNGNWKWQWAAPTGPSVNQYGLPLPGNLAQQQAQQSVNPWAQAPTVSTGSGIDPKYLLYGGAALLGVLLITSMNKGRA